MDELEEIILALQAAGIAVPNFKILDDGVVYFYYGQQKAEHLGIHIQEPRNQID